MKHSDQQSANKSKATHSFIPGLGYVNHAGEPPIPPGIKVLPPVKPEGRPKEGSLHRLRNHGGGKIIMKWEKGMWAHPHAPLTQGNRMAFTPEHLGRAGWSYIKAI